MMPFFVLLMDNYHSYFIFISTAKTWKICWNAQTKLFALSPLRSTSFSIYFCLDGSIHRLHFLLSPKLLQFVRIALHENNVTEKDITLVKMHKSTSSRHATKRNAKRRREPGEQTAKDVKTKLFRSFCISHNHETVVPTTERNATRNGVIHVASISSSSPTHRQLLCVPFYIVSANNNVRPIRPQYYFITRSECMTQINFNTPNILSCYK